MTTTPPPSRLTPAQSIYLDLLRAGASWAVLFGHAATILSQYIWLDTLRVGAMAVLVFFLLSGFLISYSVLLKGNDPRSQFTPFMIDRFCRIFCAYIPALAFVLIVDRLMLGHGAVSDVTVNPHLQEWMAGLEARLSPLSLTGNVLMLQDYPVFQVLAQLGVPLGNWYIRPLGSGGPLWTVAIEWWIYLVFGIATYALALRRKVPLWGWALGAVAFPVVGYNLFAGYNNCLTLVWIMGLLACLLFVRNANPLSSLPVLWQKLVWPALALAFAGLVVLRVVAIKIDTGDYNVGELQFSLYLAGFVFSLFFWLGQCSKPVPGWVGKVITFAAGYSFSLYLVHNTVLVYLQQAYRDMHGDPRLFWAGIVISNVIAIAFWALFERNYKATARWLKGRVATA